MHNYTRTVEPTKERRFIDTHFWLKNGDFLPLQIQVMEGWCLVRRGGKKIFHNGGSKHMLKWNLILCLPTNSMWLIFKAEKVYYVNTQYGLFACLNSGGICMIWRNAGGICERKTLFRMKK